jgi:hypothetical protein
VVSSVGNSAAIRVLGTTSSEVDEVWKSGQVAQVVERSPEKAGVGGSTPSLATIIPKGLSAFAGSESSSIMLLIPHFRDSSFPQYFLGH